MLLLLCAAPVFAQGDDGGGTGLLTITLVILGVLCIVSIAAAGFFAILYFETLKKLKQKDAELPRRTGEREKKAGGSYYDSPVSGVSDSLQRRSSDGLARAGSLRDNNKSPYPSRSFSNESPRSTPEKAMPSPALRRTFSYNDPPVSGVSDSLQRQSSDGLARTGSSRDNNKTPHSPGSFPNESPRIAPERTTSSPASQRTSSYNDSPVSRVSDSLQRQSSDVLIDAGSSRDDNKSPYSPRSFPNESPRIAPERATPSPASQRTFSYDSLFCSQEERSKFPTEGLVYLAISEKTMQQITEGNENCLICFDKKQGRTYAEYILIKNRLLFPNYYIYNETKAMPDLMATKRVFALRGRLPGKIIACNPAQVRFAGDKYELTDKGVLTIQ
jgi:hypothetical protein